MECTCACVLVTTLWCSRVTPSSGVLTSVTVLHMSSHVISAAVNNGRFDIESQSIISCRNLVMECFLWIDPISVFLFVGAVIVQWSHTIACELLPSVLWCCWFGIRKSIWPVKNWLMRYWHGYLSEARCKWFAYGPSDATATPSSLASLKSRSV